MRNSVVFAIAAVLLLYTGVGDKALAGPIGARAGDVGRAIQRLSLSQTNENGRDLQNGQVEAVPLPLLRRAGHANPPLPPMRGALQLASYGNPYLAVLPTVIKPRLLDDTTATLATEEEQQPRPRFITWTTSNDGDADIVARGGMRQACFHCLLERKAKKYGVPFRLARAVVKVESNYHRDAVGDVGEIGLMQVRPQTARWLGFDGPDEDLFNPRNNLEYGVKYLGKAWRLGEGSLCRAILKYNAGHNAKRMNPTSRQYCEKVEAILERGSGPIRPIEQASL